MREPTVAWWPETIPAGSTCDEIATSMDVLDEGVERIEKAAADRGKAAPLANLTWVLWQVGAREEAKEKVAEKARRRGKVASPSILFMLILKSFSGRFMQLS